LASSLLIRTRADAAYGSGHLRRSICLAEGIRSRLDTAVALSIAAEMDDTAPAHAGRAGLDIIPLRPEANLAADLQLVAEISPDVVLVDLLELEQERAEALRSAGARLAVMADMGIFPAAADTAICCQLLPRPPEPTSDSQSVLYGPDFFVLDERYASLVPWDKRRGNGRVLVCFGGYCHVQALKLALAALAQAAAHWSELTVVTGKGCPAELLREAEDLLADAHVVETTDDMPTLLAQADLALVAGGFIKYEAAACGVPALIISIVDHQLPLSDAFAKSNCAQHLGAVDSLDAGQLAARVKTLLTDRETWSEMSRRGRDLVDGRGVARICDHLLSGSHAA